MSLSLLSCGSFIIWQELERWYGGGNASRLELGRARFYALPLALPYEA